MLTYIIVITYWADAITIALEVYYKKELTVYYITYIKNIVILQLYLELRKVACNCEHFALSNTSKQTSVLIKHINYLVMTGI